MVGWYLLIPSGNKHTASPYSKAYREHCGRGEALRIQGATVCTRLNEMLHDCRVVCVTIWEVLSTFDRYGARGFDQPASECLSPKLRRLCCEA